MRWLGRILGLAVLIAVLATAWFGWWWVTLPGPAEPALKTDAIVVLTGGPGRLARGVALMKSGSAQRMLVSGVDPLVTPAELAASAMAPESLFDCCVDLGHEAIDTRSNAEETVAWMRKRKFRSLRLVTAADHMSRAQLELQAELDPGMAILADAVPRDRQPAELAREFGKYALRLTARQLGI